MPQSFSQAWYHIIWSTKKRWPFLSNPEISASLHRYLAKTCSALNCNAVIVGGFDDHIHIWCKLHRTKALSKLVEELKKSSSKWIKGLQDKNPDLHHFYWQKGYAAFSVSRSNLKKVEHYIQNQEKHHTEVCFQSEYRQFLTQHQIQFDEKYVWD